MTRIALLLAVLAVSPAAAGEPDEATKVAALKLAYILNGNSMVRHPSLGSIDVSKPLLRPCTQCSPVTAPQVIK